MSNELLNRILSSIFLIPLSFYAIIVGSNFFISFISVCFLISIYEWHSMTNKKKYNIIGFVFIFISFYFTYKLRFDFSKSYIYFLFTIVICISTDIGGFLFGKLFKGPKLSKISPNKTYSGVVGSYFFSLLVIYILKILEIENFEFSSVNNIYFFVLTISTTSQIGDLVISYFKRLSNLKNTGKIIPGHGGLLDRIDGMIFAFPLAYVLLLTNLF